MRKFVVMILLLLGVSATGLAQSAGKGSSERNGGKRKPRKQMQHFEKQKKDPNMKHNGTSYRRNRKSQYNVDGDGFSAGGTGKRKRGKKTGVK